MPIVLKEKSCAVCQRPFQPRSGAQMTCGSECKLAAKNQGLGKGKRRQRHEEPEPESEAETDVVFDRGSNGSRTMRTFVNGQEVKARAQNGDGVHGGSHGFYLRVDVAELVLAFRDLVRAEIRLALSELAPEDEEITEEAL